MKLLLSMGSNNDLLDLKIGIKTEDETNFLELAIFFDKPEFLRMLSQFRKDYGIDQVLDTNKYRDKINELFDKTAKINFSKYQNPKELVKTIKEKSSMDIEEEMDMFQMLDTEVNLVCYQFKRPPCFADAVKQAVFCGTVEGDWLETTSVEVIEDGRLLNVSEFQLPQVAILISPTSTFKTLKSSFEIAQLLYKSDPRLSYFHPRVDFVNNIRKYRDFYWDRLAGKTYQDIADRWVEKQLPKEDNTTYLEVMRGVKIYTKLLQK